jgi:DHA3 family macrolide efflux protein-like MFS transporter
VRKYYTLLKEHRVARLLTSIQLIAYFGAWFSNVAIYTLLANLGASPMTISLVAVMHFLPAIIQAPISGAIIDRVSFKPLMFTLLLIELVMTLMILSVDSLEMVWLLMILIFVKMSAASFYFTSEMSLIPHILEGDDLKHINELHSIIWSFTYTVGMALGGLLVNQIGIAPTILLDAFLFVIAIVLFSRLKIEMVIKKSTQKIWINIVEGFQYIKRSPKILYLIVLHGVIGLTAYDALVALLADRQYKEVIAVALALGYINSTRALGLTLGPLLIGNYITKENLRWVLILQGVFIYVWAYLQADFYHALVGLFLTGLLTTTLWSLTYAMLQEATQKEYLGRVIAYNDMVFHLFSVGTSLFIGYAFEAGLALDSVTYILGSFFILAGVVYRKV